MSAKLLRSTDKNYVELEVQQTGETEKALKVSDGIIDAWIPKSQLEDDVEQLNNGLIRVVIPEWLAKDKGFI